MTWDQKIEAVKAALIRHTDPTNGKVLLTDLADPTELNLLWHGATFRGLLQFIRINYEAWGGIYVPAREIKGDPRAFRDTDRLTRWTEPKYIFNNWPGA